MSKLSGLFRSQSGVVGVTTAVTFPLLVGFAALGIEVTGWYVQARSIEAAADDAALTAAVAYAQGNTSGYTQEATSVASSNGYTNGVNGVTVTVNMPPTSGSEIGNKSAVQVNIVKPITPLLAATFVSSFNVNGQGVAIVAGSSSSNGCVLALNTAAATGATLSGSTNITLANCSFDVNATSATKSLVMNGGAVLTADSVNLGGGADISGNATLTATNGLNLDQPPIANPYADRQIPSFSGCNQRNLKITSTPSKPLQPGVYCGGINISGGAVVTLAPGIYILDQGDLSLSGGSTLNGTDATIILTSSAGASSVGNVVISGGTNVNLVAPTTGASAGIAIWQDARAPDSGKDNLTGGSTMDITGAIYLPSQSVTYTGGASNNGSGCTQLIALNIKFSGNSVLANNNCSGTGVASISSSSTLAQLVQ